MQAWIIPGSLSSMQSTPASCRSCAYCSASSRSGSCSQLSTEAGASPCRLVVSSASSVSPDGEGVRDWLAGHRRQRTAAIIARLQQAQAEGELADDAAVQALGDHFATVLHGISVQARDGISRERLLAMVDVALSPLP